MMFGKRKGGRILVVEDDWDILEVLKLMLEDEGHVVATAKHGRDAIAMAASGRFDVIVMDISMPQVSGIDVARALRSAPKTSDIYIVIHTGLDEHWVRERFADYDVFLTKAEDAEFLVEQIARLLAGPKRAGGRPASSSEVSFSPQQLLDVQQALRASMGLEQPPLSTAVFLDRLQPELAQLRRLGRSNVEIAEVIAAALEGPFASHVLDAPAASRTADASPRREG